MRAGRMGESTKKSSQLRSGYGSYWQSSESYPSVEERENKK